MDINLLFLFIKVTNSEIPEEIVELTDVRLVNVFDKAMSLYADKVSQLFTLTTKILIIV